MSPKESLKGNSMISMDSLLVFAFLESPNIFLHKLLNTLCLYPKPQLHKKVYRQTTNLSSRLYLKSLWCFSTLSIDHLQNDKSFESLWSFGCHWPLVPLPKVRTESFSKKTLKGYTCQAWGSDPPGLCRTAVWAVPPPAPLTLHWNQLPAAVPSHKEQPFPLSPLPKLYSPSVLFGLSND